MSITVWRGSKRPPFQIFWPTTTAAMANTGVIMNSRPFRPSGTLNAEGDAVPAPLRPRAETLAHSAFISGLNSILLVAAFVLFAGAILAFVLVRQQDFVASGPAVEAAAG